MLAERVIEWTKEWEEQGMEKGLQAEARRSVLTALDVRFAQAPEGVREHLERIRNLDVLRGLYRRAMLVPSLQEFAAEVKELAEAH